MTIKRVGAEEDRSREQFTAEIVRHPPGEGGLVYVAEAVALVRANTLNELQAFVADFAWEETP